MHLSVYKYAERMGVNPIAFVGGKLDGFFGGRINCGHTFRKHSWQSSDNVSREDISYQLRQAEIQISNTLAIPVAPEWRTIDMLYPREADRLNAGLKTKRDGSQKNVLLPIGDIISGGVMAVEAVQSGIVLDPPTDEDGDTFAETYTFTFTYTEALDEIEVYAAGYREEKIDLKHISRTDDTVTVKFFTWHALKPELHERLPLAMDGHDEIDIAVVSNRIDQVDVIRRFNDDTQAHVEFIYDDGSVASGYVVVPDDGMGMVTPYVGEYDDGWASVPCASSTGMQPRRIKLHLYAGTRSDAYINGHSNDPLDMYYAETIRLLATARLDRDLCGCPTVEQLSADLRRDMALISPQGNFLAISEAIQECPFGTRRGEWLAWNRLNSSSIKWYEPMVV